MKIYIFEAREDEVAVLQRISDELGVELTLDTETPTLENAAKVSGCQGVSILGQGKIDRKLLTCYRELGVEYLSTRTIGVNHIDLDAARELGIKVCNAEYPPDSVAEFTIMLMLMCLRHYKQAMWRGQVNDFSLSGMEGRNLSNLTVGIIGTGRIGARVAENLAGFGCRILAWSRHENEQIKQYAQYADLETIYREADIISLHLPLTPQTEHMIDRDSLRKMKDGVILVNTARGGLTDIEALVEGIETEKIGALGMDTVEGEEGIIHQDHRVDILVNRNWFYLHQFRNVIMTQHMAFYTEESVESMAHCGVEGIVQMSKTGDCSTLIC